MIGKVTEICKKSSLSTKCWLKYISGILIILFLIFLPIVTYKRLSSKKILKFFLNQHIYFSIIYFAVMLISLIVGGSENVNRVWTQPLKVYHATLNWLGFFFASSSLASFVTVLFAWTGGILSLFEIAKILRGKSIEYRLTFKD